MLRQIEREHGENVRHQLDNEFDVLRDLIYAPDPSSTGSNSIPLGSRVDSTPSLAVPEVPNESGTYDQYVRELAFEKRAKPKDRTKTEEEVALEEKEALEKAERRRRKRMLGSEESDSEAEGQGHKKRKRGGDDLDDDFADEDAWGGLGEGLGLQRHVEEGESDLDEGETDGAGGEGIEDQNSDSADSKDSEVDAGERADLVIAQQPLASQGKSQPPSTQELPFTFPCPSTHEEFLSIVDDVDEKDIPTVVKRVRTLHHTSLAPDNKFKLQVCQHPSLE